MKVTWKIDVDEETDPVIAALEAYIAMRVRSTIATIFSVVGDDGKTVDVDVAKYLGKPFRKPVTSMRKSEDTEYFLIAVPSGTKTQGRLYGPYVDRATHDRQLRELESLDPTGVRFFCLTIDAFDVELSPINR